MKRACRFRRTRLAAAVGSAVLSLAAGHAGVAYGSAFALQEQSGSGLGNAFAGGAAAAEDASTIFFNPAGMSRLTNMQAAVAGSLICLEAKFSDNGSSQPAAFQALGGNGGDAGSCAVIPAIYLASPINNQWSVGIGVNVPFGLKTDYDSDWLGRFQAVKSKIETINVNPAVSFKASDMVTIGGGANYQHIKAELTSRANYAGGIAQAAQMGAAAGAFPPTVIPPILMAYAGAQSDVRINGNDNAWGWNIGALVNIDPQTRFGASYRSTIKYNVSGTAEFFNPPVPALPPSLAPIAGALSSAINSTRLANGDVNVALKVPDTANVSIFRQIDSKWDVMGDLQYTGWSSVQNLTVVRSTGVVLLNTPENFRDTWRASIGANYHYSDQWMFRGGLAYDQSPVRDAQRTPRLPDNDRTWISIGAQYKFSPQLLLDAGYTYIFVRDPNINQNAGDTPTFGLISGTYKSNVNIVAAQLTYTFK
ncbi:MAG TPA: outer membrane protein transport protein [Casimicrobiaceae bacterium]|nr:outer membrane protein transport protein [Casimicrobiaceae bacterium]